MDIRIKYRLFKDVGGRLIPDKFDSYEVINVSEELDPDSAEGLEEIQTELSRAIGEPKTNFKVLGGTLV